MKGFTLIEVMVVLVIVGVMAGLTTLGMERLQEDPLNRTAGNLSAWMQASSDDAVLYGSVLGASVDDSRKPVRLQRYYYSAGGWRPLVDVELSPVLIPENISLWEMDDRGVREPVAAESANPERPDIVFFPTGMTRPDSWQLEMAGSSAVANIDRDDDGLFVWRLR